MRVIGQVKHARNSVNVWLRQCDCGRTLEVDQGSLVKGTVPACKTCRCGPCVICSKEIDNDKWSIKRNTCSDECNRENRRIRDRVSFANRVARAPHFHKKHYQRKLAHLAALPENERVAILRKE